MLEPGTFAADPLPSGAPWRWWAELEAGDAEALGWYAPRSGISDGPTGQVLLAPGDVHGAVVDPALVGDEACCGLDGGEPNMVCVACGTPVAIRVDDCGLWQAVWLDPRTTCAIEDGPGPHPVLDWADLIDQRPAPSGGPAGAAPRLPAHAGRLDLPQGSGPTARGQAALAPGHLRPQPPYEYSYFPF